MNPPSLSINPTLGVGSYSLISMSEAPIIPADVIMLDEPPSISLPNLTGDEDAQTLGEIMIKLDEYRKKHTEFSEQRKGLLSKVIVPPIEEYRKLHIEIWQLHREIKALEIILAEDKARELRNRSVANRVSSSSSSVMSSSTSSTSQSSGTSFRESLLSKGRVNQHGMLTVVEGDTSRTCEGVTRAPGTYAHDDSSNTDSSFSSENLPDNNSKLGDSKESKVAFEESSTSFSDYAKVVRFDKEVRFDNVNDYAIDDEGPTVVPSNFAAAQKGISTAAQEGISICNEHIMDESDLNQYSQETQVELRRINEQIETLKVAFETMREVAIYCSIEEIEEIRIQRDRLENQLDELTIKQRNLITRTVAKKAGVEASLKREEASSSTSSLSSQTSVAEVQRQERRIQILKQVLAQVSALGELDEGQFKEQARVYNQQRRAFFEILGEAIKDVSKLKSKEILNFENSVEEWRTLKKNIESMETASASTSSHLTSTSSSSNVTMTSRPQYKEKDERKVEKTASANQEQTGVRSRDITETRAKQLKRDEEKIFILENLLKAFEQVKKLDINDTFVGEAETAAREYNRQYQLLLEEMEIVLKRTEKVQLEKILVRIEKLKRYQGQVLKLKAELDLQYSSVATVPLSQADKERYLKVFNQLQARISRESGEIDSSFFKEEHRARVKKYNADQLKLLEDLNSARSKANELIDDRISIRIKNMESRAKELNLENHRLYDLLLS